MLGLIQKVIVVVLLSFYIVGCQPNNNNVAPKAKYVFLFIGDGMGIQQVNAAQAYKMALDSSVGNANLSFTQFPATGFVTTFSGSRYITCSAAAGTAIASGTKTSIGTIGLNANHIDSLFSVAHNLNNTGFQIGLVTSVSIDHATPAAFYAHQPDRDMYHEIGHDLIKSNFRFFASGGFKDTLGKKSKNPLGNVIELGKQKGILFTSNLSVSSEDLGQYKSIVYSAPNPAPASTLQYAIDAQPADVTLSQLTQMGIDVLKNPKGFFMMVEGGKIDWACHDNDAATTIQDVYHFSDAIQKAVDFYNMHPNETLIIVTADHETGGMSLGTREHGYENNIAVLKNQKVSQEKFDFYLKNLIKEKNGKPSFDEVLSLIQLHIGLGNEGIELNATEKSKLKEAYNFKFNSKVKNENKNEDYSSYYTISNQAIAILNKKAGIGWTSYSHTGSPVPIYALGVGHEQFIGQFDNTQIAPKIVKILGL
jgi:alkaline phosphatase